MSTTKDIEALLGRLDKQFGKGILRRMDDEAIEPIAVIPSGSLALDAALGVGGYPVSRIIELYGGESSGKTTLTLHAIAEAQKLGGMCAFIDAEHAFDKQYAASLGVDMSMLYMCQPDNAEQALELMDHLVQSAQFSVVVLDSVAALVSKKELDGEMGDSNIGVIARLMSQAMRKLVGAVAKTNTTAFFINQTREKIGVMFGSPITTTGGNALKFYASVRLEVSKGQQVKDGDDVTANKTRVKVVKNKVAPPFRVAEFQVEFGVGIDKAVEILELAVENNIVQKAGSWYSYQGSKLGQGAVSVVNMLKENPDLLDELTAQVRELYVPTHLPLEEQQSIIAESTTDGSEN